MRIFSLPTLPKLFSSRVVVPAVPAGSAFLHGALIDVHLAAAPRPDVVVQSLLAKAPPGEDPAMTALLTDLGRDLLSLQQGRRFKA